MRVEPELKYQDYVDGVHDSFNILGHKHYEKAENITDWMCDDDDDLLVPNSTSLFMWLLSIGVYEVRHNILEDRIKEQLSYHIPRYHMGKYIDDLFTDEKELVERDVAYFEKHVQLLNLTCFDDDKVN